LWLQSVQIPPHLRDKAMKKNSIKQDGPPLGV
jgi:hypothetical protein